MLAPAILRWLALRYEGTMRDTFQTINGPVAAGRQRASSLRFAEPRTHPLLQAVGGRRTVSARLGVRVP
jgi:hypothetical protein